jgi:predicted nucleotidyltransferase
MAIQSREKINIEVLKEKFLPILKEHKVIRAGIFGSIAEGIARETSDVDILVEFAGKKSLLDLASLKLDLESAANRRIDLSTYKALNPLIKQKVLEQEVRVL